MTFKSLHRNELIKNYICQLSGNPPFCFKYSNNAALLYPSGLVTVTVPPSGQTLLNEECCKVVLPFQASHVILLKFKQSSKAYSPIVDKLLGNVTEVNDEQ